MSLAFAAVVIAAITVPFLPAIARDLREIRSRDTFGEHVEAALNITRKENPE